MKACIPVALFALAIAATAQEPAPPPPDPIRQEIRDLTDQIQQAASQITELADRVDALEKRLGEPDRFRAGSLFDTIESRLKELEDDVDELDRPR